MNHTLKKWIVDTVAADMRSAYRRAQVLPFVYDFMERYADCISPLQRKVLTH